MLLNALVRKTVVSFYTTEACCERQDRCIYWYLYAKFWEEAKQDFGGLLANSDCSGGLDATGR